MNWACTPAIRCSILAPMDSMPLVVSAIVVDPMASGAFANPARVWVGGRRAADVCRSPALTRVMVAVRLHAAAMPTTRGTGMSDRSAAPTAAD